MKSISAVLSRVAFVILVGGLFAVPVHAIEYNSLLPETAMSPAERSFLQATSESLIARGMAPERVEAKGYGDSKPVAVNMTAQGRAKNNRTEIRVKSKN